MFLSMSTIILTVTLFNIGTLVLWCYLRNYRRIAKLDIGILISSIFILLLRMFIPFEFFFQFTLLDVHLLPNLYDFLYFTIVESGTLTVYMYHILLFVWLIGAVVKGTKKVGEYIKFKKLVTSENGNNDEKHLKVLRNINYEYKKHAEIKIIKTDIISVPMIFGILRPTILLPKVAFTDEELYYILKHEATHYYRHDLWIKLIAELSGIIYWWNPLTLLLNKDVNRLLEINVDRTIIQSLSEIEKLAYLDCLLRVIKDNVSTEIRSFSLALNSQNTSVLHQRFNSILDSKSVQKSKVITALISVFILVLSLISFLIVIEPLNTLDLEIVEGTVEITSETAFILRNEDESIDIYINNQYFVTLDGIPEDFKELSVYTSLEEANKIENE